jgi:DNA-binding response OmpR family regulator
VTLVRQPNSHVISTSTLVRFDEPSRRIWIGSHAVPVTVLELRLLRKLHEERPRLVTRETLLRDVWMSSPKITTRSVDAAVARLRTKLGPSRDSIKTVHGLGYRWDLPV